MVDNQEKIALLAEIEGLKSQLRPQSEIDGLSAKTEADYQSLIDDINMKYEAALNEANQAKDRAMEAAQLAMEQATEIYEGRVIEIGENKSRLEADAETYYQQLKEKDADAVSRQEEVKAEIVKRQERLQEIEVEEARFRAEEEARIKAQAEEAKRLADAQTAQTASYRPKIKF